MRFPHLAILLVLAVAAGAGLAGTADPDEQLWTQAKVVFAPLPDAAVNPDNPATQAKIDLGKQLYFDRRLSKDGTISCNSCHDLSRFGVDNKPTSPGDGGELGSRNSPTVLNAALHVAQFWDGRAPDVEEQAGMPILNPIEMAIPEQDFLVARLHEIPDYDAPFAAAFPGQENPVNYANLRLAIAAFERTLLTPSRFDQYLRGDRDALTAEEKDGLRAFMEWGCTSCHNGVTVGGHIFRKFGLNDEYWKLTGSQQADEGRKVVTGNDEDRYVFKVASLRNVSETHPYFHDGSVEILDQAIRVMANLQVGLDPSEEQVALIATFLKTLTGEVPESAKRPFASPAP